MYLGFLVFHVQSGKCLVFFSLIDLGIANDYIESDVIYYLK